MLSEKKKTRYLDSLKEFLKIPSISALSRHKKDIKKAVGFLKRELKEAGFEEIKELYGKNLNFKNSNPVIFAQKILDLSRPTVLIYGHYDVQPADPPEEWTFPPFEPTERNGNIYARGATDDKGQLYTHIAAVKELQESHGQDQPVNIKFLIEGEEESGGKNIEKIVLDSKNRKLLEADVVLVSDSGFIKKGQPAIEYGLRGITAFEIDAVLSDSDLHSGIFGGCVMNPVLALADIFSKMYNRESGKILIPGFYDDVRELGEMEKRELARASVPDRVYLKNAGNAKSCFGEHGFSTKEREGARPSLDINGIEGGFRDEGFKTIIPSKASAKFSVRLVPDQDPQKVEGAVVKFIKENAPEEVEVSVRVLHRSEGVLMNINSSFMKAATQAFQKTFGKKPVFTRSGGSIPVISLLRNKLGTEVVMMGYGLPDDNLHSPNEKFSLEQFYKGIECNLNFYSYLSKLNKRTITNS